MIKPIPILATDAAIAAAASAIQNGDLVAFGTETVYGLGGDATNSAAVAKIYAIKNRPAFNPLISHVDTAANAFIHGISTAMAERLADAFWPGAMTLILDRLPFEGGAVCDLATAGLDSIALRVPANPQARQFLKAAGCPVAAPSANKSGGISPTHAEHVVAELGGAYDLKFILNMGVAEGGVESAVIDARGARPQVLRPGAITNAMIEKATGLSIAENNDKNIISPGQMQRHYAPSKPVMLNICAPEQGDIMIGFGSIEGDFNLSQKGCLTEAAANLYHVLRQADAMVGRTITVAPIPNHGLGLAINDRLTRATATD
ncbi:MAG: L-threonylcarbamoyladenylate synthase [Candidatus Puniceispirillales bacterium WSBS_2018_MAG_OTU23]